MISLVCETLAGRTEQPVGPQRGSTFMYVAYRKPPFTRIDVRPWSLHGVSERNGGALVVNARLKRARAQTNPTQRDATMLHSHTVTIVP